MKALMVGCVVLAACGEHGERPADAGTDAEPPAVRVRWSIQIGDTEVDRLFSVASDSRGNVYASGRRARVSENTLEPDYTTFVTKRDAATGAEIWTKDFERLDRFSVAQLFVTTDADDNLYVGGTAFQRVQIGGTVLGSVELRTTPLLMKWTPQGEIVWSRVLDDLNTSDITSVNALSSDQFGRAFIDGVTSSGGFLTAYDADGTHAWTTRFPDQSAIPANIAVCPNGDIAIVGTFFSMANVGGGPLVSSSFNATFVARFDRDGSHLRSLHVGQDGVEATRPTLAVSTSGRIVVQHEESLPDRYSSFVTGFGEGLYREWSSTLSGESRALASVGETFVSGGWTYDVPTGQMGVTSFDANGGHNDVAFGSEALSEFFETSLVRLLTIVPAGRSGLVFGGEFEGGLEFVENQQLAAIQTDIFLVMTEQ